MVGIPLELLTYMLFGGEFSNLPCPQYQMIGPSSVPGTLPLVDISVAVCGERIDTIMDTVTAASSQDYPCDRYRVFILDDARDQNLQERIEISNTINTEECKAKITYFPGDDRPKGYKAGNLNSWSSNDRQPCRTG